MNPLIPMFRQAGNGPHLDHVQSNHERLEDWRMRMLRATGIEPTRQPYSVIPCQVCGVPVWVINPKQLVFRQLGYHRIPVYAPMIGRCDQHNLL